MCIRDSPHSVISLGSILSIANIPSSCILFLTDPLFAAPIAAHVFSPNARARLHVSSAFGNALPHARSSLAPIVIPIARLFASTARRLFTDVSSRPLAYTANRPPRASPSPSEPSYGTSIATVRVPSRLTRDDDDDADDADDADDDDHARANARITPRRGPMRTIRSIDATSTPVAAAAAVLVVVVVVVVSTPVDRDR